MYNEKINHLIKSFNIAMKFLYVKISMEVPHVLEYNSSSNIRNIQNTDKKRK